MPVAVTLIVWVPLPEQVAAGIAGWVVITGALLIATVTGLVVMVPQAFVITQS